MKGNKEKKSSNKGPSHQQINSSLQIAKREKLASSHNWIGVSVTNRDCCIKWLITDFQGGGGKKSAAIDTKQCYSKKLLTLSQLNGNNQNLFYTKLKEILN